MKALNEHAHACARALWIVAILGCLTACGLPRDASGSLARIRGDTMRVGAVIDTPWVTDSAGALGGIEPGLVRTLAQQLGATVEWVRGGESELLPALHDRALDLVIGGLTASSPWKKQVAFTRPYYVDTGLVAPARGAPAPPSLGNAIVAVKRGDAVIAKLRKKGARIVAMNDLRAASGLVAAPVWRIAQLGRVGDLDLQLAMNPHVLAASPGENAWLVRIEQMLFAERSRIPLRLRSDAP
jgi:polar amino acid transport system substrate-binding protein